MAVSHSDAEEVVIPTDNVQTPLIVPTGISASQIVRDAGLPTQGPTAIVVVKDSDGLLRDLSWIPAVDTGVTPVAADTEEGRSVMRHSTAHILAQAVQQHFPDAKLGIGPPITDGFYYDFLISHTFTPEDLEMLSKTMSKIIKDKQRFSRRVYSTAQEALTDLVHEPLKQELIGDKTAAHDAAVMEVGDGELTAYDNLDLRTGKRIWFDLCKGPHIPTTKHIPAFALLKTSAAYWRGDQKNPGLQRIYGTAWESQEALDQYLARLEEAERRDHRKLGVELDLFSFPTEIGSGLPVFHPNGGIIRAELEGHSRKRHIAAGYNWVNTPHISKSDLFALSGHLDWYKEGIYPPMHLDEEHDAQGNITRSGQDYYLKPMNCPMHNLIFRSRGRSYRELPLRLFEFGTVYRYEKSGVVQGLTRARGFTQDDAHIYCTEEQVESEITSIVEFVLSLLTDYGLDDYYLELSTRDDEKYIGSDEVWEQATRILEKVAQKTGLVLVPDPGGAAFYGPKISVQARDALGRTWQMSTIQVDFNLPERFNLEYTASDGTKKRPVMIHRALFGSIERFFGVLTEHYGGLFPAWLSPLQLIAIPVAETFIDHLDEFVTGLQASGIRAEVDYSDDRMQKKIHTHTKNKVPFLIIAGERDVAANAVSFRFHNGTQINGIPVLQAQCAIKQWITEHRNDSPSAQTFEPYCLPKA